MKLITTIGCIIISLPLILVPFVHSHCEIPCGIYHDKARVEMIEEHITTIEKAVKMIGELSKEKDKNYNQIVRWVTNKEEHASMVQEIVSQYFMTQRVKPAARNAEGFSRYVDQLTLLHQMLVYAMKAKQTTDLAHIEKLRSLVAEFKTIYFSVSK